MACHSQNDLTMPISSVVTSDCLTLHSFPNKLYSFLSGKLKDFINTDYFSTAALQYKNRKNLIKSQCHMAKEYVMGDWANSEKDSMRSNSAKPLRRPCYQDNITSQLL